MDRFDAFATPIFVYPIADAGELNGELAARLLHERQSLAGLQRSNVGGWHSEPNLSQRPEPCFQALVQLIVAYVDRTVHELAAGAGVAQLPEYQYGVHGWAMVMHDGDYVVLHDHGDAHWSIVYYVDAGDDDDAREPSGQIVFVDPRRGGRPIPGLDVTATNFSLRPRSGTLVVFPGWLQHYVHPYRGQRPRISISCNVVMKPA